MNTIELDCCGCGVKFLKQKKIYNNSIRQNPSARFYCSAPCQWKAQSDRVNVNCKTCGIDFGKRPSQIKRTLNHFCSRVCAAKYNNVIYPKRAHENMCKQCGQRTLKSSAKYCEQCRPKFSLISSKEKTIAEIENNKGANRYSPIRDHARAQMKHMPKICSNCKYDKHVQCCHIKAVASFSKDTKLSVVNSIDNLIYLCPNCHWEFDHGRLEITPVGN